jgi:flavin-dependent dehydrogenase
MSTDVVILGGGPAGLAAGLALRAKGIECMVVDALAPPIDKGCGEGLMPDALECLRGLGVEIGEADGHPFKGIRFANSRDSVTAEFPNGVGFGVRRTHLHQRMADRAETAGVKLMWRSKATLQPGGGLLVNGVETKYQWLVGADGSASQVRRWAGLGAERAFSQRFGFRRHYRIAPWSEFVEVHWGAAGQIYVTPVGKDCVCVALVTRRSRVESFFEGFPEVARRLEGAPMVAMQRGAVSATRKLKRVAKGPVALLGDASGSADAITGEGLALSFRQAVALASSIEGGGLEEYAQAHRAIGRLPHAMAKLMLTMDRWPWLERRGMRALASETPFFQELLAVHMGAMKLPEFAVRRGAEFSWRLVSNGHSCDSPLGWHR